MAQDQSDGIPGEYEISAASKASQEAWSAGQPEGTAYLISVIDLLLLLLVLLLVLLVLVLVLDLTLETWVELHQWHWLDLE